MKEFAIVSEKEAQSDPYPYVYVEDDGSYRELHPNEKNYLQTKFHGADGNRPYVKSKYKSKTPDGKLGGYLERTKLPQGAVKKKMNYEES